MADPLIVKGKDFYSKEGQENASHDIFLKMCFSVCNSSYADDHHQWLCKWGQCSYYDSEHTDNSPGQTTQSIPTVAPTTSATSNVVVKTATATVDAKSESVLTDVRCMIPLLLQSRMFFIKWPVSSGCIDTWPPLLFKGTGTVSADTKLPGDLTTDTNPSMAIR